MKTPLSLAAAVLALGHLSCNQAILTASPGSTIFLSVNPGFVPAHGGVAVVSALVMEETGTVAPDGTVVQFFTTLGRIQEQGRTNDGVARVNFTSDSRSGEAIISAISGPADGEEVTVLVGAVLPARVIVTAMPPRIPLGSRTTNVTATVLDANGNPVPNVPVIFRVVHNPATEFIVSGSQQQFTDSNGIARDVVRTQRTPGTGGTAEVEAIVLSAQNVRGEVVIPIE